MKQLIYILTIFLFNSCSDSHQNSTTDHTPIEDDTVEKQIIQIDRTSTDMDYDKPDSNYVDYWCSTDILRKTEKNIDNLDLVLVADFLATFHESCENNAEFSEWSNELLFKVISKKPDRFLELISKNSSLSRDYIIDELKSPIHDQIDLDIVADNIEKLEIPNSEEWKSKIINSLETAKEK